MEEGGESLVRIDDWLMRLRRTDRLGSPCRAVRSARRANPISQFEEALDDDLNISAALGFLFETIVQINRALDRDEFDAASANAWLNWWQRINKVLEIEEKESVAAVATGGRFGMKGTLSLVPIKGGPLP